MHACLLSACFAAALNIFFRRISHYKRMPLIMRQYGIRAPVHVYAVSPYLSLGCVHIVRKRMPPNLRQAHRQVCVEMILVYSFITVARLSKTTIILTCVHNVLCRFGILIV